MKLYIFRVLLGVSAFLCTISGFAQSAKSTYFMKTSYTRNSLNPALRPDQGYIGFPMLSNIYLDATTNTFNLDNLTFPVNGERVTFMHPSVSKTEALSKISDNNYVSSDLRLDILAAGFYAGDSFWNINLGVKSYEAANVPKSVFELLKVGFEQEGTTSYDLSNINATVKTVGELGIGYSRPFMNKSLILGTRLKLIAGIADMDLNVERLGLTTNKDFWKAKSQVTLKASAPGIAAKYTTDDKGRKLFDGFDFDGFSIAGYGLGVDLGGVYDFRNASPNFLKNLKLSLAVNDIGFVSWENKNTVNLASPDTEVKISSENFTYQGDATLGDIFDDAFTDLKEAVNLYEQPTTGGRTTKLRMNLNAGAEYSFFNDKLSAGLLYSAIYGTYFNVDEYTVSANIRPNSWFATTASYSLINGNNNTFGLAIHLAPSKGLNLFVASDYTLAHVSKQYLPTTSNSLNFQMGISIPMGGKRK